MIDGEGKGLTPITGATHSGLPLGYSRPPCDCLRKWVARFGVTRVDLPAGRTISCSMFNESAGLRIILGGNWRGWTSDGVQEFHPGAQGLTLLFGPHSRAMRVSVDGSFSVVTINFTAGAMAALGGAPPAAMLDRLVDYDKLVGHGRLSARISPGADPDEWINAIEAELLTFIDHNLPPPPNRLVTAFEEATLGDPTFVLADFAANNSVSQRTLERLVLRGMGVTPGLALRRARALDMAAVLLGVAIEEEEPELRLRYFDQSHLIREMRHFFDCTPRQFIENPHPLLRISVEMRQARRVRLLERVALGELNPWRDPAAEPRPSKPARMRISRTAS